MWGWAGFTAREQECSYLHLLPRPPTPGWPAGEDVLIALSGQVILCTKEVSVGARKNAFALLVEMGHAFLRFGPSQEGEAWVMQDGGGCSAPRPVGSTLKPLVKEKR